MCHIRISGTHLYVLLYARTIWPLRASEIDHRRNDSRDNDPHKLVPVEERDAYELWCPEIVERRKKQRDEGNNEEQAEPATVPALRTSSHNVISFCRVNVESASICAGAKGRKRELMDTPTWIAFPNPTVFSSKCQLDRRGGSLLIVNHK
jgi:hypothetical protein